MEETHRKVPPKGTPERREYDRLKKAASRSRLRAAREVAAGIRADDFVLPPEWKAELDDYADRVENGIRGDLGSLEEPDIFIVRGAAQVLLGLKRNYIQRVTQPSGFLVGGWFPEARGSEIVERAHRYPRLMQSKTFTELYRQFLEAVAKWSQGQDRLLVEPECVADVLAALAGTYKLPEPPKLPKPPDPKPVPPSIPTERQMLDEGRRRLLRELYPDLPQSARDYLNGEPL